MYQYELVICLKVKYWITINEPYIVSESYGNENAGAPALNSSGFGDYLAIHHTILAHATAYHLYNREFRTLQNGNNVKYIKFYIRINT